MDRVEEFIYNATPEDRARIQIKESHEGVLTVMYYFPDAAHPFWRYWDKKGRRCTKFDESHPSNQVTVTATSGKVKLKGKK